jgi:hypothetical protein
VNELNSYNKLFNVKETNEDSALWLSARNTEAAKAYGILTKPSLGIMSAA